MSEANAPGVRGSPPPGPGGTAVAIARRAKDVLFVWARSVRTLALVPVAYLIAREVFARISGSEGLITPEGSVSIGVLALGALMLVLRVIALLVVPAVAAYRLASAAIAQAGNGPAINRPCK